MNAVEMMIEDLRDMWGGGRSSGGKVERVGEKYVKKSNTLRINASTRERKSGAAPTL